MRYFGFHRRIIRHRPPAIIVYCALLGTMFVTGCQSGGAAQSENASVPPMNARGIETVQKASGVFYYTYAETLDQIDPLSDYQEKREITDGRLIQELKGLMASNEGYSPEFKARCLPMYEYGLEFRESPEQRTTFLFSFRCNTVQYVEDQMYKDFTPQSVKLYSILRYEVDDDTSELMDAR